MSLSILPRDEVKHGTIAPRDGCAFLTLWYLCGESWRSELAHVLLDAPYTMCYMDDETTCRRYWEKAEKGTLVIACDEEVARFVGTLPFFARLCSLHIGDCMLMPLSACKLLTYVCMSRNPWRSNTESELHSFATNVMAEILRELPVLRAVRFDAVFDPSVITASCSRSLVSFECDSCVTCENSMPHLEHFTCNGLFGMYVPNIERVTTALRGCVALRTVFVKYSFRSLPLFETLLTLPQLKEAILPCYFRAKDGFWSRNGTSVTHGTVCQLMGPTDAKFAGELMILLPALSYLLRVRMLSLAARVVGIGHSMLQWVVFSAPSPLFARIWKALREIGSAQRADVVT